jgi:hypothetical protein
MLKASVQTEVKPKVGIKVCRPPYYKAPSIKHGCRLVGSDEVGGEQKYDGEYYQMHVRKDVTIHDTKLFFGRKVGTTLRIALRFTALFWNAWTLAHHGRRLVCSAEPGRQEEKINKRSLVQLINRHNSSVPCIRDRCRSA